MKRSPARVRFALLPLLFSVAALFPRETPAQICPVSTLWTGCWDTPGFPIETATFAWAQDWSIITWSAAQPCEKGACFDLPGGAIETAAEGQPAYPCANFLDVVETYRVEFPSGSGETIIRIRMHVTGSLTGSAAGSASIVAPSHTAVFVGYAKDSPIDAWLEETVSVQDGSEFQIRYQVNAIGGWPDGDARLRGDLHFEDVPSAMRIVACHGYDIQVQTNSATWGQVKALYR